MLAVILHKLFLYTIFALHHSYTIWVSIANLKVSSREASGSRERPVFKSKCRNQKQFTYIEKSVIVGTNKEELSVHVISEQSCVPYEIVRRSDFQLECTFILVSNGLSLVYICHTIVWSGLSSLLATRRGGVSNQLVVL